MSLQLWKRLTGQALARPYLTGRSSRRDRPRHGRNLAFESLETRELMAVVALQDFGVSENTGEKPQSKSWEHAGQWWSVMPKSDGTWVWRLDGTSWTPTLRLTTANGFHADVKATGELAHVLLFGGQQSQLASIEYVSGPAAGYRMWSLRPQLVGIGLSSGVETATLDVDSTGRLWVGSDGKNTVEVRYSDGLYTSWSAPIIVASGINSDDISVITAMPGNKIGILWSNQTSDRFGFKVHLDGASALEWSGDEVPASQSALNVGGGMADDHLNVAVASDGTLYAAVKTSYDSGGRPKIALLVRRPNGVWENLHSVDGGGTRPIIVLNEAARKLIVAYTTNEGGGDIVYRESSMDTIAFGARQTLIRGSVNNVTSTKQNFASQVVVMASSGSKVKSVLFSFDTINLNRAPVVSAGSDRAVTLGTTLSLDGTASDDGLPASPGNMTTSWTKTSGPGTVSFGNSAAVDTTAQFSAAGTYVLRLTANDGSLQTFDELTVVVHPVASTNLPPIVSAGMNLSVTLGQTLNLSGSASDDGLPTGTLNLLWTLTTGPGPVTFGNNTLAATTAQFNVAGSYVLRLTASDGSLQSFHEITITVTQPVTQPTTPPTDTSTRRTKGRR